MANKTVQEKTGSTPNGGVRSEAFFRDAEGNPVSQEKAVSVEVIEYDAKDQVVGRTYGDIGPGKKGTS